MTGGAVSGGPHRETAFRSRVAVVLAAVGVHGVLAGLVGAIAVAASLVPAISATRIDPVSAFRSD